MRQHNLVPAFLSCLCVAACGDDKAQDNTVGVTGVTASGNDSTTGEATGSVDPSTTGETTNDNGTTGGGSTGSDTMTFVGMPDVSVGAECDVWGQDCPVGEKCAPWANDGGNSWNATKCVPVDANPKQPGDECTTNGSDVSGQDNCDVGSLCFSVNPETNVGLCTPFCQGSEANPTCADPTDVCNVSNNGALILCLDTCNPLLQDCQTGGQPQGCYPVNDEFLCWPDFSFDLGAYGDPCQYFNVCDPGLYCAAADVLPNCVGSTGCCTEYCDVMDANASCAGAADGVECVPWWGDGVVPPPGMDSIGACIMPV